MKILSQDKTAVAFTENLNSICEVMNESEANSYMLRAVYSNGEYNLCLGIYSTQQKTDMVLQMIFESKLGMFIMPQEDEVEV